MRVLTNYAESTQCSWVHILLLYVLLFRPSVSQGLLATVLCFGHAKYRNCPRLQPPSRRPRTCTLP